jgi:hypothetical protein
VTVLRARKDFVTETYAWDAADRLQLVRRDGFVIDQRRYDGAGRLVQSAPVALPTGYAQALNEGVAPSEQLGLRMRRFDYDANGRLLQQATRSADGGTLLQRLDHRDYSVPIYGSDGERDRDVTGTPVIGWRTVRAYDDAGNAPNSRLFNFEGRTYTNWSSVKLERLDGYVERQRSTTSSYLRPGSVTYSHDANGHLVAVDVGAGVNPTLSAGEVAVLAGSELARRRQGPAAGVAVGS